MAVFKPKIKETIEDRLQKAINLGREEALKEVLEWLNEITDDADDVMDRVTLPQGSIEKLLGRELTWGDEPVEI